MWEAYIRTNTVRTYDAPPAESAGAIRSARRARADGWQSARYPITEECPVNQSGSDSHLSSWCELSAPPRWRTRWYVGGHKLVSHAEQVPQHVGIDAREANQNGAVAGVVVRHVVNIGGRSKQLGTIIEIDAHDNRTGFGRAMSRHTGEKFSVDLERREPVRGALLHAGQRKSDNPYSVEVDSASRHWSAPFRRTHCSYSEGRRGCDYPQERELFQDKSSEMPSDARARIRSLHHGAEKTRTTKAVVRATRFEGRPRRGKSNHFTAGGRVSMPARPPITLMSEEPVGTTILELLVSDVSTACSCRSSCALPLK